MTCILASLSDPKNSVRIDLLPNRKKHVKIYSGAKKNRLLFISNLNMRRLGRLRLLDMLHELLAIDTIRTFSGSCVTVIACIIYLPTSRTSHLANNDHRLVTCDSVMPRTPAFLESLLPLDLELELTDSVLRRSAMGVRLCLDQPTT